SREHYRFVGSLFDELLQRTGKKPSDINLVTVARGPGLLGSLLVGVAFAKGLALGLRARFLGVNHLHAHLLATCLEHPLTFPALGLLVSGGHTHLYHMEAPSKCTPLGRTLDDAAGEAFDKVAKILGLSYPGGRLMDALAREGRADSVAFPRPYLDNDNLDFSFSGLKTAASSYIQQAFQGLTWPRPLRSVDEAPQELKDCCAAFNAAVVDTLCKKTERALNRIPQLETLILAGGVASNSLLRQRITELMERRGGRALIPSPNLCTDNAAMIAFAGWLLGNEGFYHHLNMETIPRGRAVPNDMQRCQ
ncbi:MAG: tRNA (adenosine(37)-N6)-threonylcarbamoyltransferase complex transferase subunit TsaD, partial [Desulfovibrio sp.]|nr:tRNA (adenosine(37)-N6)-threonylcarbamoyltransferase complex transferase subunit TsaD [Desulfovibrio sp.]